ncbi:putative UV excision repair protein Rad23 [Rosa chinensis]|uniref:Putative UV excision repair protein Rad23 n=1 Tax=Rosa chinensis TaxID=74649 RepID=A0A2P6QHV4_ROSCH|nr:NEDD8 ultimate buster 1 [Rosa chinensis]PRQ33762.1 putative UV excision repair protein Rad23 [Rosa chinensis]
MAKVKIAGAWAGVLEVDLDNWTVSMLRQEVAKRSNCEPNSINLICAGKVLKDGDGSENLTQLGIKNNSKVLASRVSAQEGKSLGEELLAEGERSRRLARIKAAATAMAKRHADGSLPIEDFNIELEDQSGKKVKMGTETDQQAIMMGLMLHTDAKKLIKEQNYKDALEVLSMGEEAFSLCDPKVIELVDNPSILQIDMVWCYFMLRDINRLSVAGVRLEKAREGLERAHGKDASRVRLIQAGRYPERALHLRLELLEGVVAYHSGEVDKSKKVLTSAQEKFRLLQVSDESLSLVMSMGFKELDAKRALRMSNQDVSSAVDFLVEQKAKRDQKREDDIRRQHEIKEQKTYGVTPLKKAVELERLNELVFIGFQKELAAEALRRNENDSEKALDDLTNPETNSSIQEQLESRKRKRQRRAVDASVEALVRMGFERSLVDEALQAGGTMDEVIHRLLSLQASNPTNGVSQSAAISTVSDNNNSQSDAASDIANSLASMLENQNDQAGSSSNASELQNQNDQAGSSSNASERDAEMESELAEELAQQDALSDYDLEVTKEGEAIAKYLVLLDSAQ